MKECTADEFREIKAILARGAGLRDRPDFDDAVIDSGSYSADVAMDCGCVREQEDLRAWALMAPIHYLAMIK